MASSRPTETEVAARLAAFYEQEFGGRQRGRYRISMKHMRALTGRRRIPRDVIDRVADELFEMGLILIDMETFLVVLSQRPFASYRRINDKCLTEPRRQEIDA